MRFPLFILGTALAVTALFIPVQAQEITQAIDLSLESIPANPQAGQNVTIRATSYSVDLNEMSLSWSYQGSAVGSGFGKTSIIVAAPASGTTGSVQVLVSGAGVDPITATLVLRPGSIDLLWEGASSSVPPFYKGRPLVATDGFYRVVGIPAPGAPTQLNYQWSYNGSALPSASGSNRQGLVLKHNPFATGETISLSTTSSLFQGSGSVTIPIRNPEIVLYQKRGSFIDFANGTTGTLLLPTETATLHFEPFFFSTSKNIGSDLSFSMKVGDEAVYAEDAVNEFTLSRSENASTAQFSVAATTKTYSLQNAARTFTLLFQ